MTVLADRVALVTGASKGLGRQVVRALANAQTDVALLARSRAELEDVAAEVRAVGRRAVCLAVDVTDADAVDAAATDAVDVLGPLDVLVNCAGTLGPVGRFHEADPITWSRTVEVNLGGTVNSIRAVLPGMISRSHGSIVNLSGGGATSPRPRFSAYAVSKAGVVRLTETLAAELEGTGVRVNAVAPGVLPTAMVREIAETGASQVADDGALERAAQLVVFLASDASAPLSGRLISAPHDPWPAWCDMGVPELGASPLYTLRRIDPYTLSGVALKGAR